MNNERAAWTAHAGLWLWRHGLWLPLLALALAAAAAFAWDTGAMVRRAGAEPALVLPTRSAEPADGGALRDAERLAEFRRVLAPADASTASVRRLVELTRPQLAWQRAEFQHSEEPSIGVRRLQITIPVSGEYAALRQSIERSLLELPFLSLDQVMLRRVQPDASALEVRLRFSLWFASPAPEARS